MMRLADGTEAFDDRETRVLLAVLTGARTYGNLIERTRVPRSTLHAVLTKLREEGLVTWEPGKQGTIRPTVQPR